MALASDLAGPVLAGPVLAGPVFIVIFGINCACADNEILHLHSYTKQKLVLVPRMAWLQ